MSIAPSGFELARFALACMLIAACAGTTDPSPLTTGSYALLRYNGQSLPFDLGPMGPKGQNPGGCAVRITSGLLALNVAQRSFSFTYDIRNGCTQELMSQPGLFGTYTALNKRDLTFIVTYSDGQVTRVPGSVSESTVVFRSEDEVLEFSR